MNRRAFIESVTVSASAPLVPEFSLRLATEITPVWQATEAFLQQNNLAPPFWAFAWPGSQALARYVLDHRETVAGRCVLDFGCGCGVAALAASRAGAAFVEAADIDPVAAEAAAVNAAANGCAVSVTDADVVGAAVGRWDLVLCGDVFYEAPMTRHILPWLRALAAGGAEIWVADPGRAYLPAPELAAFARYDVPTSRELEDRELRTAVLYRLLPCSTPSTG